MITDIDKKISLPSQRHPEKQEKKLFFAEKSEKSIVYQKKCITFTPLFGVTAGRQKSGLAMLRWNDKQFYYKKKWI